MKDSYSISLEYTFKLIRLIRDCRIDWRKLTDEEIMEKAIYHYGGSLPEALIDAILNV